MKRIRYIFLVLSLISSSLTYAQFITIVNKKFVVNGNASCPIYLNGANTPWEAWNDFGGSYNATKWAQDMADLKAKGINAARIWFSCNGDGQPTVASDGTVSAPSAAFWTNCDHLFTQAQTNGVYIMATMMSFDHTKTSNNRSTNWRNMMNDTAKIRTYINNYLIPFVNRYKTNPYLFSIDICNEIEWIAENTDNWKCSYAVLQRFVGMCCVALHSSAVARTDGTKVLVTMGSAATKWNATKMRNGSYGTGWQNNPDGNKWSDAALQAQYNNSAAYLDFYSPHFYGWINEYYSNMFEKSPTDFGIDDKACMVGEMPARDPFPIPTSSSVKTNWDMLTAMNALKTLGWQGHMPWTANLTTNLTEEVGTLSDFGADALSFKTANAGLVVPTCSANVNPTVSLTSPTNGATATAPATITLTATATDSDGTISKVEFYDGTTLITSDASSPYTYSWTNVSSGTHVITAKAYDNSTGITTSTAVTITVNPAANNTPPSCVITQPHCNAYFQAGTDITIRVYASDIGGSYTAGSVTKVEFYNGTAKIGEATTASNNTYTFVWTAVAAGTYTIKAKATDNLATTFTSAGVIINVGAAAVTAKGLSTCKGKYLANIIPSSVRSDYGTYWNGVTAENSCKWGSVEGTRDVMNWTQADVAYNYAKNNNLMFRYHAIAWGSQYPTWIEALSTDTAAFRAEIIEYMTAVAARYPLIDQIDVLNEQLGTHAAGTPYFRDGLGGTGTTGYDWQIWLFTKARQIFPNAKLVLNDYGLENDANAINSQLLLFKVLRDRGLVDGFGTQAHCFNVDQLASSPSTLNSRISLMANSGVPVYVTELDLNGGTTVSEATQLTSYQNLFPIYWDHPAVAGITIWGYVEGSTWKTGTGLLNADGTKRSCMTWLETYMSGKASAGYPYCASGSAPIPTNNLLNGEFDNGTNSWEMQYNSSTAGTFTVVTTAGMSGTNAAKICPTTPGTANWHVQLRQNAPFEMGKNYEISFMAKADAARTMDAGLQMEGDPWTSHWGAQQNLTTANQSFTYTFSPTLTDATAKLKFYVGNNSTCVYLDNVVFKEITTVAPTAVITASSATTFCTGGSVMLNANTGTGYTYQWKNNGSDISGATSASYTASTAGSYTVVVTANSLSTTSAATVVTVNAIPAAPAVTTPVTYAQNATATALTATGTALTWYTVATGGTGSSTAPIPSTTTLGSTTYYVSQTVSTCESSRAAIVVTINPAILTQTISLQSGWNFISINVNPADSSIATIFSGKPMTMVKNADGFWKTGQNASLQSLTHLQAGKGYLVQMTAAASISVQGTAVNTASYSFPTTAGWHMIGCPYQTATNLTSLFTSGNTDTIKDFNGYWTPGDVLSTISTLAPGKGYYWRKK